MARHQGDWARTTARVLSHLREKSRIGERTVRDQDQAAIDKVWAFVGVRIDEYDRSGQCAKVAPERREGVRQRLHDGFLDDAAFLPDGHAARKRFMRADLLKWGNRLLAAKAVEARSTADPTTAGPTSQPTAEPTAAHSPGATSPPTAEPTLEPSVAGPTTEPTRCTPSVVRKARKTTISRSIGPVVRALEALRTLRRSSRTPRNYLSGPTPALSTWQSSRLNAAISRLR